MGTSDVEELRNQLTRVKLEIALTVGRFVKDVSIPVIILLISLVVDASTVTVPVIVPAYGIGSSANSGIPATVLMQWAALLWISHSAIRRSASRVFERIE
jgi:hypothetical protein